MRLSKIRRALAFFMLLAAAGCARNDVYRSNLTACDQFASTDACAENALLRQQQGRAGESLLGFVEFDDQGQLRNRAQMRFVLNSFRAIAGKEDVLLLAFVHGWHHNASYEDSNVQQFSRLLAKIAEAEARSGHRKVLGLYVGWRGESLLVPGFNSLTFWERKNTAHKVGSHGVVELLLNLEEIVNVREGETKARNSRLVVIGHSFGGAVTYTALQQILADRFVDTQPKKTYNDAAKGFGDLVLLLNPAFEALRYSSLYDLSQQRCSYFDNQLPKLVILTSEADWATGKVFPVGRSLSTFFETHNTLVDRNICTPQGPQTLEISEGEADRTAVGHFEPYLTHELYAADARRNLADQGTSYLALKRNWMLQRHAGEFNFGDTRLINLGRSHPRNPYLNVRVDNKLISGHNDIWGDAIINFVRDFIAISTLPGETSEK